MLQHILAPPVENSPHQKAIIASRMQIALEIVCTRRSCFGCSAGGLGDSLEHEVTKVRADKREFFL